MADWLSERSGGRYHFVATAISRQELDALIRRPAWRGVVAWVNPRWFGPTQASADETLAWTEAFARDADIVVSRAEQAVDYLGDGVSLEGRRICDVSGRRLPDVQWLLDAGRLQRLEAGNELACLQAVRYGHSDAAFVQSASFEYWRRQRPESVRGLIEARQPRLTFGRHLSLAPHQAGLLAFLNQHLAQLAQDPAWRGLLREPPRQLRLVSVVPLQRADAQALRRAYDTIFDKAGLRYAVAWRPAERALQELREGLFDGDMGRPASEVLGLPDAIRVDPAYASSSIVVLRALGQAAPVNLSELRHLRLVLPKGYALLAQKTQQFAQRQLVISPLVCARMVAHQRADACLTVTDIGGRWIGQQELGSKLQAHVIETLDLHLWLQAGLDKEAQLLGQSIAELKRNGELTRLMAVRDPPIAGR